MSTQDVATAGIASPLSLDVNPMFDVPALRDRFQKAGRLRIRNFLRPSSAELIYRQLVCKFPWRTFLVSNERLMGTPPDEPIRMGSPDEREIFDNAYTGARNSFACLFDADRLYPELLDSEPPAEPERAPALTAFDDLLASPSVVTLLREIAGINEGHRIYAHATRFRTGHFVTFHAATLSADKTGKRRATFYLNLTPEWKPEWGGLLEFRTEESDVVEAFVPTFNTLDLLTFPHGHWISPIAPFAGGPTFTITGHIYAA